MDGIHSNKHAVLLYNAESDVNIFDFVIHVMNPKSKYTIDICMQMLASAKVMMMNTKDYLYSLHHHHTRFMCWGTETKKETNKLGET